MIIEKGLNVLKYILDKTITSMMREANEALKENRRKGVFVDCIRQDMEDVAINYKEEGIISTKKIG